MATLGIGPAQPDNLRPPSADSSGTGALMSLLAHALLVAALAFGVQWRTEAPAGVEAELWAAVPEIAAPPAQEPPPEPVTQPPPEPVRPPPAAAQAQAERDAQIAVEKAERLEKERKAAEDERARAKREQAERDRKAREEAEQAQRERQKLAEQKQAEQQREKAEAAKREKLRQDQLQRMNAQLSGNGAANSTGTAARDAGPSANYAGRIKARIKPNIVLTDPVDGNPSAEVEVRVAADGSIIGRRLLKPSGNRDWDEAVLRAVDRTGVLPRDTDGRVPPVMVITFRPQD